MRHLKIYLPLVFLILSCSAQGGEGTAAFDTHTVKEYSVFLSTETSGFVGTPVRIKAAGGGLYFSDVGFRRIFKTDSGGDKLLSFGSQGRGPGEFESPTVFWVFDDNYLVYDYNGFKFITYDHQGELVEEKVVSNNPINPDGFPPNIPITVAAISPDELLIPSRGRDGSLFAIADIKTGDLKYAGNAIGEHVESFDSEEVDQAFSKGEIPAIFINMVALAGSSSGIYSFQQTTGILEKYSRSGDPGWEKNLVIPEQHDLFDRVARRNRSLDRNTESHHLFNYAKAIDASEEGVAVMLNMPEEYPVTVAWVPKEGDRMDVVTIEGLDQEEIGFLGSFSVSPSDSKIYFLNIRQGLIYEADWPV